MNKRTKLSFGSLVKVGSRYTSFTYIKSCFTFQMSHLYSGASFVSHTMIKSSPGLLLLSKQIKGLPKGWNLQKRCPSCLGGDNSQVCYESKNPSQDSSNIKHFKHHSKQELIFSHPLTKPEPKADKVFSKTGNGVHVPDFRLSDCRLKHKTVIKDDYRLSSLPVW